MIKYKLKENQIKIIDILYRLQYTSKPEPTTKQLASIVNLSEGTVQKHVKALRVMSLIKTVKQNPNTWTTTQKGLNSLKEYRLEQEKTKKKELAKKKKATYIGLQKTKENWYLLEDMLSYFDLLIKKSESLDSFNVYDQMKTHFGVSPSGSVGNIATVKIDYSRGFNKMMQKVSVHSELSKDYKKMMDSYLKFFILASKIRFNIKKTEKEWDKTFKHKK